MDCRGCGWRPEPGRKTGKMRGDSVIHWRENGGRLRRRRVCGPCPRACARNAYGISAKPPRSKSFYFQSTKPQAPIHEGNFPHSRQKAERRFARLLAALKGLLVLICI